MRQLGESDYVGRQEGVSLGCRWRLNTESSDHMVFVEGQNTKEFREAVWLCRQLLEGQHGCVGCVGCVECVGC